MATLTATSTGTGMETGTGIPTHIPTILTGQPATASCTDSSAMHYYQQVSVMRLNTCMSSTRIFVNIINRGSVIISHPLPLATSKQMQSLRMPDEIQSDHNTCIHFLWCHCPTLATRKNWQRPRMHFLSPSVQTPHTLCGLHHMHRRFVSKLLQFEHVRDCAVTYFRTFGNLLRHFSDMIDTGPWLLLEMWCERHQFFPPFSLIQRAQLSAVPHPPVFSHVPQRRLLNSFPPLHSAHLHSLCFLHPYTYPKHLLSKIKGLEPSPKT